MGIYLGYVWMIDAVSLLMWQGGTWKTIPALFQCPECGHDQSDQCGQAHAVHAFLCVLISSHLSCGPQRSKN